MMNRIVQLDGDHDEIFSGEIAQRIPYHRMNGKQYCLPAITLFQPEEAGAIQAASESVDRIYRKVLRFAQQYLPDEFLVQQLGLHPALLSAARMQVPCHGVSRQDWIINEHGMKCIENNTDTPTGIPETAYLAEHLIHTYTSFTAASIGMRKEIQSAFGQLIRHYAEQGLSGPIVFSSYGWHLEDRTNTEYLMQAVNELGYETLYVPLEELEIVPGDGLYAGGQRIAVLYRLYPLEYLIHDTDEEQGNMPIGEALIQLVVEGKLGLINPAQSIITQSKGFMALIWSLYARRDQTEEFVGFTLFDGTDIADIDRYLLPTYYEAAPFVQAGTPYVAKGYWGREGKGTSLYDGEGQFKQAEWGHEEADVLEVQDYYDNQPKIYQHMFPMQEAHVETEEGSFDGYLLTGAYVIGGCYAGLLPRIGGKITGDMAYYCPAAITYTTQGGSRRE
ncbi:glutathionylspermidine synthase family protein [Paenibacillus lignilyticus]